MNYIVKKYKNKRIWWYEQDINGIKGNKNITIDGTSNEELLEIILERESREGFIDWHIIPEYINAKSDKEKVQDFKQYMKLKVLDGLHLL